MQTFSDRLIVLQEVKLLRGNNILCLPQYSVLIPAFWSLLRMQKLAYININYQVRKFLQFDWLRAVVFQLDLKYLHVKITNLLRVVV